MSPWQLRISGGEKGFSRPNIMSVCGKISNILTPPSWLRHVGFRYCHSEHAKSVLATLKTPKIPFRYAINSLQRFYTFRPPSWPAMLDFVIASRNMYNRSQRPRKPSSYHSDPLSSDCNDFTNFDRHLSPAMLDY